jgi:hypothetical protein
MHSTHCCDATKYLLRGSGRAYFDREARFHGLLE